MIIMHPGQYVQQTYLYPKIISQARLAAQLDVDKSTVSRFLSGKAELTADMAVRLSKVFGESAEFFMGMQTQFSLEKAKKSLEGFNPAQL